ncbi:MAG: MarR family transcriptional regulator [Chloroflexi bacterium]|nr:MAG: MarR family transcriptional regulator [Chloroflexota bacterium]TMF38786.1 MAG: MarR family transcriptional regulator [Chloroflexota bacterium]
MESRRETILAFLKMRGQASLAEVAAHLEVSKQGALRHLEALEASGLATVAPADLHRRGRPEHVYKLTPAAGEHFPDGHRELTAELVDFMTNEQLKQFFERRAARLEREYARRLAGLDFESRVRELARLATEHGHMAEVVEVGDGALAIRHCNCPIQDVAARTGLPCVNEHQMYERLLGTEVSRTTWVAEAADDCTYVMKEKGETVG